MTKTIYLIKVDYAMFHNNKIEYLEKEDSILYAISKREKAEIEIKNLKENKKEEREKWFKKYQYGIFPTNYRLEEITLLEYLE